MFSNKAIRVAFLISMLGFVGLTATTQASAACNLVSTKDGTPLPVKASDTDTPQAKSFLETCINPYTKAYAEDPTLIKAGGKKLFGYNGCSGCHGGKLDGHIGYGLPTDDILKIIGYIRSEYKGDGTMDWMN